MTTESEIEKSAEIIYNWLRHEGYGIKEAMEILRNTQKLIVRTTIDEALIKEFGMGEKNERNAN